MDDFIDSRLIIVAGNVTTAFLPDSAGRKNLAKTGDMRLRSTSAQQTGFRQVSDRANGSVL